MATGALIGNERGGTVVIIAPRPDAGAFARAAVAALESLARTLSVEWARYGITATVITPGTDTTDDQIAELACFLVSPAGDYFSGCRFSLGLSRAGRLSHPRRQPSAEVVEHLLALGLVEDLVVQALIGLQRLVGRSDSLREHHAALAAGTGRRRSRT